MNSIYKKIFNFTSPEFKNLNTLKWQERHKYNILKITKETITLSRQLKWTLLHTWVKPDFIKYFMLNFFAKKIVGRKNEPFVL